MPVAILPTFFCINELASQFRNGHVYRFVQIFTCGLGTKQAAAYIQVYFRAKHLALVVMTRRFSHFHPRRRRFKIRDKFFHTHELFSYLKFNGFC